jgi:hypothetical protein
MGLATRVCLIAGSRCLGRGRPGLLPATTRSQPETAHDDDRDHDHGHGNNHKPDEHAQDDELVDDHKSDHDGHDDVHDLDVERRLHGVLLERRLLDR